MSKKETANGQQRSETKIFITTVFLGVILISVVFFLGPNGTNVRENNDKLKTIQGKLTNFDEFKNSTEIKYNRIKEELDEYKSKLTKAEETIKKMQGQISNLKKSSTSPKNGAKSTPTPDKKSSE